MSLSEVDGRTGKDYLARAAHTSATLSLYEELVADHVIFDLHDPSSLVALRADVDRIALEMDRPETPPLMLWTGIPYPAPPQELTSRYCLVVSVGGTNTDYALLRLERGELHLVDRDWNEVSGVALADAKVELRIPTPTPAVARSGQELFDRIVEPIARYLGPHPDARDRCSDVLFSWGFAHRVVRTGPRFIGGVAAVSIDLSKDQVGFSEDLREKDVGEVLRQTLDRHLGWSRPVTVANDAVMALHYFLTRENMTRYAQIGLFINGTGANFAIAEDYAVRPEGVVSEPGEEYEPDRITPFRPLGTRERRERYFVNYEAGTTRFGATRTPYDTVEEYPFETNAIAGGNAFEQELREIVRARLSAQVYERLLRAWRGRSAGGGAPRGPEVSRIAEEGPKAIDALFPGAELEAPVRERLFLVCRAIVARSALHAALLLAAVSRRVGFGFGSGGKPDLLALEGSVWRAADYQALVRHFWQELVGRQPLEVDFAHEKNFNASLPGPLYLAAIQSCQA